MQEIRRKAREQTDEDVAAAYREYRKEKGLETGQDGVPGRDCRPCPDCNGNGMVVKEIPILRVKAGKICKTCGGRGYLPKEG